MPVDLSGNAGAPHTALEALRVQLAEREAQVASLHQALERLMHTVSHDLRAPLRHITSYGQLLAEDLPADADPALRGYVDTITGASRQLAQMLDALLELARIGRVDLQPRAVDMAALLAEARTVVAADAAGRAIDWQGDTEGWPRVAGDAALLRRLWELLLSNAVRFTGRVPQPCIAVACVPAAGAAQFSISDNGAGFNPAFGHQLFGVFQRLHTAKEFPGLGAGLAMAQRIVERHGGRIEAQSPAQEGRPGGCVLRFTLPLAQPA